MQVGFAVRPYLTEGAKTLTRLGSPASGVCPECGRDDVIRYGTRKGLQVYKCKPCNQKFTDNDALPGKRVSPEAVGDALAAFYDGFSYRDIQWLLDKSYGFRPSTATLYGWVQDYSDRARRFLKNMTASTGGTWVSSEMVVRIDGREMWLWSVMDEDSRYLLATHLSYSRTTEDAAKLLTKARSRAVKCPQRIDTNGLDAYQGGVERAFGDVTRLVVSESIRSEINNGLAERLFGTIRERSRAMRRVDVGVAVDLVMEGFILHYNHMKRHADLGSRPVKWCKSASSC